ncbi:MAG: DUF2784 domain-containing protein [Deltaproteobacteria bacterium]
MVTDRLLADVLVSVHALFVGFVLAGLPLAFAGRAFHWEWTRNFWFRAGHLAAILFVVGLTWMRIPCPLTVWENRLRELGGQARYPGDWIGYWVHRFLFYQFPPWVFATAYTLFALAVLTAFWIAPPHWPTRQLPPGRE